MTLHNSLPTVSKLNLFIVANTAPSDLPVSTATQAAINNISVALTNSLPTVDTLNLFNVSNTKPSDLNVSAATQAAITTVRVALTDSLPTVNTLKFFNVASMKSSDLPVSIATQSALNLKAPCNNPSFTGIVNVNDTSMYKRGISGYIQTPNTLQFAIGTSSHTPLLINSYNAYLNNSSLH